jgi:hypothetical protein
MFQHKIDGLPTNLMLKKTVQQKQQAPVNPTELMQLNQSGKKIKVKKVYHVVNSAPRPLLPAAIPSKPKAIPPFEQQQAFVESNKPYGNSSYPPLFENPFDDDFDENCELCKQELGGSHHDHDDYCEECMREQNGHSYGNHYPRPLSHPKSMPNMNSASRPIIVTPKATNNVPMHQIRSQPQVIINRAGSSSLLTPPDIETNSYNSFPNQDDFSWSISTQSGSRSWYHKD